MRRLFFIALFSVFTVLLNAQTEFRSAIENLLPPPKSTVDLMEIVYPKRFQDLTIKMQKLMALNKDWLWEYVKKRTARTSALSRKTGAYKRGICRFSFSG
jgi:hypothetical protein